MPLTLSEPELPCVWLTPHSQLLWPENVSESSVNVHILWFLSELCHRILFYHTRGFRWLFAFLNLLISQTTKEANHYFFSWSNLNTKYWNQGYKKDLHFQVLPFFLEKASRRISQGVGSVQRIWEEPHNVPPTCTQAWEFQSQITNTMDYSRTLQMQWLFAVRPELILLLQGTWSNS